MAGGKRGTGDAALARFDAFESRLFVGAVMHLRMKPRRHQFRHRVFALWLDIDRLETAAAGARLFGFNRWAPVAFYNRDHGPRDGGALRPWVEARLDEVGAPPPARIMLLSFPRIFGYVFNPLSVYYGYDADGELTSLVYEVKNTVGGQHAYPVLLDSPNAPHARKKTFYVSPFIDMDQTYEFTAPPPGDRLALRIKESGGAEDTLIATWNGQAEALSDRRLSARLWSHPLMTLRVIALIHWHAVRLILKGAPFQGRRMATLEERRGSSSSV